jgi:hypothetical protein
MVLTGWMTTKTESRVSGIHSTPHLPCNIIIRDGSRAVQGGKQDEFLHPQEPPRRPIPF